MECVFISLMRTECGMLVMRGCAVSRKYLNVCNSDMFSVVNVYLDHLLCVLMI